MTLGDASWLNPKIRYIFYTHSHVLQYTVCYRFTDTLHVPINLFWSKVSLDIRYMVETSLNNDVGIVSRQRCADQT